MVLKELEHEKGHATLLYTRSQNLAGTVEPVFNDDFFADLRGSTSIEKNDDQGGYLGHLDVIECLPQHANIYTSTSGTLSVAVAVSKHFAENQPKSWGLFYIAPSIAQTDKQRVSAAADTLLMPHFSPAIIRGRPVVERARAIMFHRQMTSLVDKMAELVDAHLTLQGKLGGTIEYLESFEDASDWEIVVVTKVALSRAERFDLSLKIGEAINELLHKTPNNAAWAHVSFRLDLASVK